MLEIPKCLCCDNDADWIRYTQFAGNHPFCTKHAKEESDFGEEDSYMFWEEVRHNVDENKFLKG